MDRKAFDFVVAVTQAMNTGLREYLGHLPQQDAFHKEVATVISYRELPREEQEGVPGHLPPGEAGPAD